MKNQFYLTELNFAKSKSQIKINDNSRNNAKPLKSNKSFVYKNKASTKYKETILEYLIKEEIQYVDLFKCDEFYQNLNNQNKKDIDKTTSHLIKKKTRIDNLENQIRKVSLD